MTIFRKAMLLLMLVGLMPVAVETSELAYKPTGHAAADILTSLSVRRIADRDLSRGYASIQDGTVQIVGMDSEYLNSPVLLTGKLVKTEVTLLGTTASITGMVYFNGGTWLPEIDDTQAVDFAFYQGGFARGHIAAFSPDSVTLDKSGLSRQMKLQDISELRSPRVYTFQISATANKPIVANAGFQAEAPEITFRATMPLRRLAPESIKPHQKRSDDQMSDLVDDEDMDMPKLWPTINPFGRLPGRMNGINSGGIGP